MGTNNNGVHSVLYRVRNTDKSHTVDWHAITELVWQGRTIPAACSELGYDWGIVDRAMSHTIRSFLLDVSMVAGAREEYLGAS